MTYSVEERACVDTISFCCPFALNFHDMAKRSEEAKQSLAEIRPPPACDLILSNAVMVLKLIKLMSLAKLLRPKKQVTTSLSKVLYNSLLPFLISYTLIIFILFYYLRCHFI